MAVIDYKNNSEETGRVMSWWNNLVHFLEKANLIPFVVVVSVYHYYQALAAHDPAVVAGVIAVFVDLLHYRTVQQAAITKKLGWIATGVTTTVMAWGLQWQFYNGGWEGLDPAAIIPSLIVPLGVAIWAWHTESGVDWRKLLATARNELEKSRNELETKINSLQSAINDQETQLDAAETKINSLQLQIDNEKQRRNVLQSDLEKSQSTNTTWKQNCDKLKRRLDSASELATLAQSATPLVRAALRYNANDEITLEEALKLENLPASKKSTLSKLAGGIRE